MAKKNLLTENASLPPTLVLSTFLLEQKRAYVIAKLKDFGLVKKEFYDKKIGHKKKDFPFKKFLGRRYRVVTAALSNEDVDELFNTIQVLVTLKTNDNKNDLIGSNGGTSETNKQPKRKPKVTLLGLFLTFLGFVALAGGGYIAYTVYVAEGVLFLELAAIIAASSIFFALVMFSLAKILRFLRVLA
jgi:hypothetical protein